MIYAGIGSRETPEHILTRMANIGAHCASQGHILRSGGAIGADQAFESGCDKVFTGLKEIYYAADCTPQAEQLSSKYHPAWDRCTPYARKLHGRNALIIYGRDLLTPADLVICWTRNGQATGGTGQALRMATASGIPIINLFFDEMYKNVYELIPYLTSHDIQGTDPLEGLPF